MDVCKFFYSGSSTLAPYRYGRTQRDKHNNKSEREKSIVKQEGVGAKQEVATVEVEYREVIDELDYQEVTMELQYLEVIKRVLTMVTRVVTKLLIKVDNKVKPGRIIWNTTNFSSTQLVWCEPWELRRTWKAR